VAELARFGSVGAAAYVVDVGLFNLLRFGPGTLLEHKPLTAKVLSVVAATVVAWLGNRYWTFADRRTGTRGRELAAFAVVNAGGLAIGLACLGFSHYVLGLRSPLADNISANVVGLALGTAFRYVLYRRVVFTAVTSPPLGAPSPAPPLVTPPSAATVPPHAPRRDDGALGQHDVRVERSRHAGQEHREHGRTALGELEPPAVGRDEVAREGESQARSRA
jgi:putative flippase GtrA